MDLQKKVKVLKVFLSEELTTLDENGSDGPGSRFNRFKIQIRKSINRIRGLP